VFTENLNDKVIASATCLVLQECFFFTKKSKAQKLVSKIEPSSYFGTLTDSNGEFQVLRICTYSMGHSFIKKNFAYIE